MITPSLEEFRAATQQGNVVPVFCEILADLDTPVSVFQRLERTSHFAFLLESVEKGENLGRYSFIGADPILVFKAHGNEQEVIVGGDESDFRTKDTPLDTLRHLMMRYRRVEDARLPPFSGGAVGYLAYDVVRSFENIPDKNPDEIGVPDALFFLADTVIAFDHVRHRMVLIVNAQVPSPDHADGAYRNACDRLQRLQDRLAAPLAELARLEAPDDPPLMRHSRKEIPDADHGFAGLGIRSNFRREEWREAVRRAQEYIVAGDIFQVVLSQRFAAPFTCPPFDIYRALRAVNPSPYMYYLKCGDLAIAGSSPEILVHVQKGVATVRPIAGTRPRGATHAEDDALEADLLADDKERAEHVMLVDLGRNDVGRVSVPGTVTVSDFMTIEKYSHVMHIVSNVTGTLLPEKDALDALAAAFPAGTVSGAPKIRAMQIIDELEPVRRGPYAGAIVYYGFDGSMDSCITLRTAILKDGTACIQAGAGIVADSNADSEYEETLNKARALMRALEIASGGLKRS
jgi:anthranilate synthase component 1